MDSAQVLVQCFYDGLYFISWYWTVIIWRVIHDGSPVSFLIGFEKDDKTVNLHFYAVGITPAFEISVIAKVLVPVPDREFESIIHGKSKVEIQKELWRIWDWF